jgi:hypothetical protein
VPTSFEPVERVQRPALLTEAPRFVLNHYQIGSVVLLAYSTVLEVALVVTQVDTAALHQAHHGSWAGLLRLLFVHPQHNWADVATSPLYAAVERIWDARQEVVECGACVLCVCWGHCGVDVIITQPWVEGDTVTT